MFLRVHIAVQVDGRSLSKSEVRVRINEKLAEFLQGLCAIYNISGLLVFRGQSVDLTKTFEELQVLETDTLLVMGAVSLAAPVFKVSIFKRFSAIREGDSWHVGPNSCDALVWIPNKRIRVFGILLYERYQGADRSF